MRRLAAIVLSIFFVVGCRGARVPGEPGGDVPRAPFPHGLATCDAGLEACRSACDAGDGDRCAALGMHHYLARGVPLSYAIASSLFRRACDDLHSAAGCYALGRATFAGNGVQRDRPRALALFDRSCKGGFDQGCVRFARMLRAGDAIAIDEKRAATIEEKACDDGDMDGCADVGDDHAQGWGLVRDADAATRDWKRACEGGFGYGCWSLAQAMTGGSESDVEDQIALYDKGCKLGSGEACDSLGVLASVSRNYFYDADLQEAARYYDWACALEEPTGCYNLATAYAKGEGVDVNVAESARLLYRGCRLDDARSCMHLGALVETGGEGFPASPASAPVYYAQACALGDMDGCVDLGVCFRDGVGTKRDEARARATFAKACDKGDGTACEKEKAMEAL